MKRPETITEIIPFLTGCKSSRSCNGTPSAPPREDIVALYGEFPLLGAGGYGAGGYGDEGKDADPRFPPSSEFPFVSGLETKCHRNIKMTEFIV